MYSTVMSVTSFSVVLAETFAAVGLSTIVPAGIVTLARLAKTVGSNTGSLETNLKGTPAEPVIALAKDISVSLPSLDLLLPKTAKIHAEFTFEGAESYGINASAGAMLEVVSVKAGFSALYETKSTNKITLDVDFVSVNIQL